MAKNAYLQDAIEEIAEAERRRHALAMSNHCDCYVCHRWRRDHTLPTELPPVDPPQSVDSNQLTESGKNDTPTKLAPCNPPLSVESRVLKAIDENTTANFVGTIGGDDDKR